MKTFALDSSALIAILLREPEATAFNEILNNAEKIYISAVTVLETSLVLLAKKAPQRPSYFKLFCTSLILKLLRLMQRSLKSPFKPRTFMAKAGILQA